MADCGWARSALPGELGHQTIDPNGPLCGCGNRGCLEALASGPAITAEGVRVMLAGQAPILHEIVAGNPAAVTPRTIGASRPAKAIVVRRKPFRMPPNVSVSAWPTS